MSYHRNQFYLKKSSPDSPDKTAKNPSSMQQFSSDSFQTQVVNVDLLWNVVRSSSISSKLMGASFGVEPKIFGDKRCGDQGISSRDMRLSLDHIYSFDSWGLSKITYAY